jgi:hypothetical protein
MAQFLATEGSAHLYSHQLPGSELRPAHEAVHQSAQLAVRHDNSAIAARVLEGPDKN